MKKYLMLIFLLLASFGVQASDSTDSPVLIFVSFSMPDASIKSLMREAEQIHAPVIVRGLVQNSYKLTLQRLNNLTRDNQGGIQIDPAQFKKYQINKTPAFVVRNPDQCMKIKEICTDGFDLVYGNVHLAYALQVISDQNDQVAPIAKRILNQWGIAKSE